MNRPVPFPYLPLTAALLALAGLCVALPASAQARAGEDGSPGTASAAAIPLTYDAARLYLQDRSAGLAAARAGVQARELREQGVAGLGGPMVGISGLAYAYNANLNLDLSALNQRVDQIGQALPVPIQSALSRLPLPQLPNSYTLNRHDSGANASISAVWPLYMGGATQAVRGFVAAQTQEARAEAEQASLDAEILLAQRYFGAQLAQRAARLRAQAEQAVARHDEAAQKMLAAGVIARVERLQAQAAHEDARRQSAKAADDAELAAIALARTLQAAAPVRPATPLFVLSAPIEPLGHFLQAAQLNHPGLAKVAAKKQQAEQLHAGEAALRRPQVIAFGTRELKSGNADWVAGLGVRWTLYDAVDRDALAAASLKQVEQAEFTDAQARSDISLLVERNWRAVENARRHYLALQSGIDLAQEMLRLRTAGLREGTSTTLDLIDAQTHLAKAQTERAQAANDYVQALAQLLQSAGLSARMGEYIARADIRLENP